MPIMDLSKVRVVDPILTSVVQGHVQSEYKGRMLFPEVPVEKRSGYIIVFGKEDFALYDTRRAPGARTKRRTINYGSEMYSLYQDALEGELPMEYLEESQGLPMDLQREAAESAKVSIDLRLEYDQAKLATDPNRYATSNKITLSGTSKWSDSTSKPKAQVNAWKEVIRQKIGVYPNTLMLTSPTFNALDIHPEIRDQFKYTSDNSLTTDMLRRYFNVENVDVATAVAMDETTGELADVWGNNVILAYVPRNVSSRRMPSYGYTYTLRGYPISERPYYDQNHRTWYFPTVAERAPVITGMDAGFLAQSVA